MMVRQQVDGCQLNALSVSGGSGNDELGIRGCIHRTGSDARRSSTPSGLLRPLPWPADHPVENLSWRPGRRHPRRLKYCGMHVRRLCSQWLPASGGAAHGMGSAAERAQAIHCSAR